MSEGTGAGAAGRAVGKAAEAWVSWVDRTFAPGGGVPDTPEGEAPLAFQSRFLPDASVYRWQDHRADKQLLVDQRYVTDLTGQWLNAMRGGPIPRA